MYLQGDVVGQREDHGQHLLDAGHALQAQRHQRPVLPQALTCPRVNNSAIGRVFN